MLSVVASSQPHALAYTQVTIKYIYIYNKYVKMLKLFQRR